MINKKKNPVPKTHIYDIITKNQIWNKLVIFMYMKMIVIRWRQYCYRNTHLRKKGNIFTKLNFVDTQVRNNFEYFDFSVITGFQNRFIIQRCDRYPYWLSPSPSNQMIIYTQFTIYCQNFYHNFVSVNIRANWPITNCIPYFDRNFNLKINIFI